ncbi:stage V sporulation protein D [Anaerosporomusa subterranea]|uniref:Stage V sporulation protein D n=1 Tax=Anaerosporomusa subterranea TaxID=1794912 RepID=A0A154BT48_ANASB|nr:stage V sporulation protein D [Anaerosporomusa subterranea]KYZ77099.1 stage V sporulation protein D [Anaerosporomusa subterranea]
MASASHGTIRKRVAWLLLFTTIIISGLTVRLMYLQFYRSSWLTENATDQRVREVPVEAKRGIVFDRNGKPMIISVSTESIYAIPAQVQDAEKTAAKMAAILALDQEKLAVKLKRRQAFTWIMRKADTDTASKIKQLNLPGIGFTQEGKRHYLYDNLASHVLGFTGIDSQGLDGVELTFDSYLKGRAGSVVIEYDARGHEIPYAHQRYVPAIEGNNLYLTIDLVLQQIVERELDRVIRETQAKAATIIAMDPRSGEVLALANRPDYNPNKFAEYSPKLWRNIAVSNTYEPGSTFKIITTAAALKEKAVKLDDKFFDPGFTEVQGRNIRCWKHGGHGSQTFVEVVEHSCNVGFVNVGLRLGRDPFYNYIESFGFGQPTNIDLSGEASGIMIKRSAIKPINIATIAIGQSIAVTPIQLLTAVSAVANGGQLLRPQIVREVKDKDNQILRTFQPDIKKQVLDLETASVVRGILERVVENGTGRNAFVENGHVAGKTGTAQKVEGGAYAPDKFIASFVGFAPANDPQIAMLVVIDEPSGLYYGGQIAAPVFGRVMQDALQYLGVSKLASANQPAESHTVVPDVIGKPLQDGIKELKKAGLAYRIEESGEQVTDQVPKPNSRVPAGSKVLLYTRTPRFDTVEITAPTVEGLGPKEAFEVLRELGLLPQMMGTGSKVVKQDPAPGAKIAPGSTFFLYLE